MNLSEICGIIAAVTVAGSMLFKNIKLVLIINFICNISGALPYLLNGEISACSLYFVAAAQCVVFLIYRFAEKDSPKFWTWVFAALFVLCSVVGPLSNKEPLDYLDLIAVLAAVSCALALAQETSKMYRVIMVANGVIWIAFDILSKTYDMLPAHIITAAAAVIGILGLDVLLSKKKEKAQAVSGSDENN